jgi:chemotaxis signal transduction protein
MRPYLEVWSAGLPYGLPLSEVHEVAEAAPLTRLPGAHPAVRGISLVGGRLLVHVQLAGLLQAAATPPPAASPVVVVAGAGRPVAFEVDQVDWAVAPELVPVPEAWEGPAALGMARRGAGWVPLLDVPALIRRLEGREGPG